MISSLDQTSPSSGYSFHLFLGKKIRVCKTAAVLLVNLAGFDVYVSSNDDYWSQNVHLKLDH